MNIYKKGNLIFVVDEVTGLASQDFSHHVMITENIIGSGNYVINSPRIGVFEISFSDINDEAGDPYSSLEVFDQWRCDNTGFKKAISTGVYEIAQGSIDFDLTQGDTLFLIPHGLTGKPGSFTLTFSDGTNTDFIQSGRDADATNIIITCYSAPTGTTMSVFWQAYK